MSVPAAARVSSYRVVFDGQSLNSYGDPNHYPAKLMSGRGIPWIQVAIAGYAWTQLKTMLDNRVTPHLLRGSVTILIGVGGTTDYSVGASGAQVYDSEVTWATNARAAGADYIIQTTTTPSRSFGANTTVASGSNGVNTNTFAGSGTLNVASTTDAPSSGTIIVATGGTPATITYTGVTGTTFTGCNTTSGGGVMSTNGRVRNIIYSRLYDGNALVLADASAAFDYVVDLAGDSRLADPFNSTYYIDGTHPTDAGRQVMADLVAPALDAILAL